MVDCEDLPIVIILPSELIGYGLANNHKVIEMPDIVVDMVEGIPKVDPSNLDAHNASTLIRQHLELEGVEPACSQQ